MTTTPYDPNALTEEDQAGLRALLAAIPEGEDTEPKDQFTTSTGIVFKLRSVPPLLIIDAQANLKPPRPPKVPNLDLDPDGKVLMENLDDPTFIEARNKYRSDISDLSNAIFLTRGTKVVSVPPSVETVESTDWSDDLRDFAKLEIPDSGRKRYYCWLKYVALAKMNDLTAVMRKVSNLAGGVTLEAEVAKATDDFRSDTEGDVAIPVHPAEGDGLGDRSASDGAGSSAGTGVS